MTSYYKIYDDQENKEAAYGSINALGHKETKSVLSEISQNSKIPLKRIAKSDDSGAFSRKDDLVRLHTGPCTVTASIKRKRLDSFCHENKENCLPAHPAIKKPSQSLETLESVAPRLVLSDSEDEDLTADSASDRCNDSSGFLQDNSANQVPLRPSEKPISSDDILSVQAKLPPSENEASDNIFCVGEYSFEIFSYLKVREHQVLPVWNYMERQRHITHQMRAVLVDWLVDVAMEYKLSTQTVYLAVSYVDRFLSLMLIERSKLQLVGTAALFLAAKYEEIYPPALEEFAYITDNAYNKKQILSMEHLILKVLGFNVSVPTSLSFLHHYSEMLKLDDKTVHLALYLTELSLLDGETFLKFPPSLVASSSLVLARHTLGEEAWPADMAEKAGYSLDQLKECVLGLYESFVAAPDLAQQATRRKFKETRFNKVADTTPVDIM